MSRERVRSAVAWRTGALGDFVLTLPVLDALRERAQELVLVAPARYRALFAKADRWIDADGPEATALFAGREPLDADLGLAWSELSAEALRGAGVREVLAGQAHPPRGVHQADALWTPLADRFGPRDRDPKIEVSGAVARRGALVIAPGSGGRAKRWGLDRWHAVAQGREALWVAGPLERDEPGWGTPRHHAHNLADLVALARSHGTWIGPDAGPQHVAQACGARVGVVFTGASDPRSWAPAGARVFGPEATPDEVRAWISEAESPPGDPPGPPPA